MRIALAQIKLSENIRENENKVIDCFEKAAQNGAEIICFPELQFSPFFPQYPGAAAEKYLMDIDSESVCRMREKCRELRIIAVPNFYLKENDKRYDASPLIDENGEILGVSKMVHIMQTENFYEQDYYDPSDEGFKVYETSKGRIGAVICFDRHYPESIRACALRGADLIVIPTANTKDEPLELFEWEVRIPAFQNSLAVAMCNRVGMEGKMDFAGESIVVDALGNVISKADDKEQILYADIEMKQSSEIRDEKPYFKLRRAEIY